jgi:nucleoside-diphosphate-sugar epimerase
MKKILITGGSGYVGSILCPYLAEKGHMITSYDLMIYGETLPEHKNIKIIKGDIRDKNKLIKSLENQDVVIHLACISNDPSFELNPSLGKSINLDAFEPLVKISKDQGVKNFIYASSSSVYGIKEEQNVHEQMELEPLTDYSKFKAYCEEILNKYKSDDFITTTLRPATVCGYSPRQRLDLVVNIFTNLAFNNRKITIFGGNQLRPNIHIEDMVRAYEEVINSPPSKINGEIFNVGYHNHSISKLGEIVKEVIGDDVKLEKVNTNDNRSYHISSDKIKNTLGFSPNKNISDAVMDLRLAFENKRFIDPLGNEDYFNIKKMQNIKL